MAEFFFPLPTAVTEENIDKVIDRGNDYLASLNLDAVINGASFRYGIRAELTDPADEQAVADAIANYDGAPTQKEVIQTQLITDAKVLITAIKNKGPANWTNQDKIILALALKVRDLQD